MKHFKLHEWADFARGLAGKREATMRKHMQECSPCRQAAEKWQQVARLSRQEVSFVPPESAVRVAKSYAASVPKEKRTLATMVAELIFDSLREPALAGVRSSATASPRQLLYRSGEYEIDLRIEPDPGREQFFLIGQILNTAGKSVNGLPVAIVSGVGREASGATNEFGEFRLEFQAGTRSSVCVWLCGATQNLLIPLGFERGAAAEPDVAKGFRGER